MRTVLHVCWGEGEVRGQVEVVGGRAERIEIRAGRGTARGTEFTVSGAAPRIALHLAEARLEPGAFATMVTLRCGDRSFTFFARDALHPECPVFIPRARDGPVQHLCIEKATRPAILFG